IKSAKVVFNPKEQKLEAIQRVMGTILGRAGCSMCGRVAVLDVQFAGDPSRTWVLSRSRPPGNMPAVPAAPGSAAVADTASSKPLGIGFPYISVLPPELYRSGLLDFVELTPDTLRRARRDGAATRLDLAPERLERARKVCGALPVVVHGVELSIGSAQHWNAAYLDLLDQFQACWPFVWPSEHLTY